MPISCEPTSEEQPPTPKQHRFVVALFLIALAMLVWVVQPYLGAFFTAAVLATVMARPQEWLARRFGGRPRLAAGLLTVAVVLVVLLPVTVLSIMVVGEATKAVQWVERTVDESGVEGLVEPLPEPLQQPARRLLRALPEAVVGPRRGGGAAQDAAHDGPPEGPPDASRDAAPAGERSGGGEGSETGGESGGEPPPTAQQGTSGVGETVANIGTAATAAGNVVQGAVQTLVRFALLIIALFFLLADGHRLLDYVVELVPLQQERTRRLLCNSRDVAIGVFVSTVVTAAAQTAVAVAGYVVAGIPLLPLAILLTFVFSLIPAVGGATIATTIGVLVWLGGRTTAGILLVLYGLLVVSLVDNVVKPWVAKGRAHLPGSIVFFAMLCGLAVFGPLGLVAGPLVVAFFQVTAQMLREDRAAGR